jgi:ribosome biogenesis GTPase
MEKLTGLIVKAISGFYYIEAADTLYECKARGAFRKKGISPAVGDRAVITVFDDNTVAVEEILPRRNYIIRPPLANLDRLFIVAAAAEPSPSTLIIDKITAVAADKGIEPVIIFTKSDLADCSELIDIYNSAGIKALSYSIKNGNGSDEIKELLKGKISAFTGNTGVGKSSLLNSLFPVLDIETGEISRKLGRGRHTTRHSELYKVGGGYVADTPGFGTVDIERYEVVQKDALAYCFPEFEKYLTKCRFTSCSHTCEKGCAVLEAVKDGVISESRHESYVAMYNEVKDIQDWQKKQ